MNNLIRNPIVILALTFSTMWLSAQVGVFFRKRRKELEEGEHQDRDFVVGATLTLLALIIGFSFSMAIGRYDQRKNCEEAEANAIGTEYIRADFLPADDAARLHVLLRDYLDQRILFYRTVDERELQQTNARTAELQIALWSTVRVPGAAQPTSVLALVVSGMNDVLNSQSYTQAALWNRIPIGAWILMLSIAICSNLLVGYSAHRAQGGVTRLLVLPFLLCISFFLIADIESPRRGIIRVAPQNLVSLAASLHGLQSESDTVELAAFSNSRKLEKFYRGRHRYQLELWADRRVRTNLPQSR
jgi:hypothetical protein